MRKITNTFKGIIDTTLRDGQQSPLLFDSRKYSFTLEEKKSILRALIALGVTHFEFFSPVVSRTEAEHFQKLRPFLKTQTDKEINLIAHCRCHPEDIEAAVRAGFDGVNLYIGIAEHSRRHSHGKTYEQLLNIIPELIKNTRKKYPRLYMRFSVEDAFRTPLKDIYSIYDRVAPYVQTFGMPDTVGIATPKTVTRIVHALKKRYPGVALETHFHNDCGLSIANAMAAVEAGVEYVDCSIWGMAERSGITSTTALLLNLFRSDKNIAARFNLQLSYPVNVLMGSILNWHVPYTEPVSLTNRTHTAGVHQKAVLNNKIVYEAHNLSDFGVQTNQILLGPLSGWNLIYYYLKEIDNYIIDQQTARAITALFKKESDRISRTFPPEMLLRDVVSRFNLKKIPVPQPFESLRFENLNK